MRKWYLIIGVVAVTMACGSSGGSDNSGSSVDAAKIYKNNCVLCHGDDGKLGLNNSKDLTQSKLTMDERVAIITNGKGTMTGFSTLLDKEEIKAVAEYTFEL